MTYLILLAGIIVSTAEPVPAARSRTRLKVIVLSWFLGGVMLFTGVVLRAAPSSSSPPNPVEFFSQKIRPLLEEKCFGCHGEAKDREADFDMRTRDGLLKGGESGQPGLIPGEPDKSRMLQAVLRQTKLKMPPKERNKLSPEEIETLRQWISAGAVWTEPQAVKAKLEY